jgi:hypothetical protein
LLVPLPMFGWSAPPKDTCTPCIDRLFSQAAPAMRGPVTLRAAFDAISKASGVPVRGLWTSSVPEGGLDPERMVQIDGNPASCGALLNAILDQVSEPTNPALWQCSSGVCHRWRSLPFFIMLKLDFSGGHCGCKNHCMP